MASFLITIHVVGAVFIFGPLAMLPMTGLRALRQGNAEQVGSLANSVNIFAWLSLVVAFAGAVYVPFAPERWHLSMSTGWVLWSVVLTLVAIALSLIVVVPQMSKAARDATAEPGKGKPAGYAAVAASSGIVSLLLVVVAIIMVIH